LVPRAGSAVTWSDDVGELTSSSPDKQQRPTTSLSLSSDEETAAGGASGGEVGERGGRGGNEGRGGSGGGGVGGRGPPDRLDAGVQTDDQPAPPSVSSSAADDDVLAVTSSASIDCSPHSLRSDDDVDAADDDDLALQCRVLRRGSYAHAVARTRVLDLEHGEPFDDGSRNKLGRAPAGSGGSFEGRSDDVVSPLTTLSWSTDVHYVELSCADCSSSSSGGGGSAAHQCDNADTDNSTC